MLAVIVYHGGVGWLRGGYLGVDVFFVLSGYLITSLLLAEHRRTGRVDFAAFWGRRARRLFPGLALLLVGIVIYAHLWAGPGQVGTLRGDVLATVAYVANWRFVFAHQSYFAQFGAPSPLKHAWSLAVEEQFYVVWPFVVAGLLRSTRWARRRVSLAGVFAAGAAVSALEMALLVHAGSDPSRVYYGTDTRAQALLIGAAAGALLVDRGAPARAERAAFAYVGGAGTLVLAWFFFAARETSISMYRGGHTLVAVATAAVIAGAVFGGRTLFGRVLCAEPLRVVGRISYGLYLWHWPVDLVLDPERTHLHPVMLLLVRVIATFALALFSWVLVERPAMAGTSVRVRRTIVGAAPVVGLLAFLALVIVPAGTSATAIAAPPDPVLPSTTVAKHAPAPTTAPKTKAGATATTAFRPPQRILLVGDSVAETLGWGLQNGAHGEGRALWDRGQLGCGLAPRGENLNGPSWQAVPPECAAWPAQWQSWVDQINPDVSIVVFDVWVLDDLRIDGHVLTAGAAASDHYLLGLLDQGLRILRSHGGRVVLLTSPYNDRASSAVDPNAHWQEDDVSRVDHWNSILRAYAQRHRGQVTLADLNAFTAPAHQYTNEIQGVHLRYDGVHFNPAAGALVYHWLDPVLSTPPS